MDLCRKNEIWKEAIYKVAVYNKQGVLQKVLVFLGQNATLEELIEKLYAKKAHIDEISKKDAKALKEAYGSTWASRLGFDKHFEDTQKIVVKEALHDFELICQAKEKIVKALNTKDSVYLWTHTRVSAAVPYWNAFVNNLFGDNAFISYKTLKLAFAFTTTSGKHLAQVFPDDQPFSQADALDLVLKSAPDTTICNTSLEFNLIKDGLILNFPIVPFSKLSDEFMTMGLHKTATIDWNFYKPLDTFAPVKRTFFVMCDDNKNAPQEFRDLYFPKWNGRLPGQIGSNLQSDFTKVSKLFTQKCMLSYIQIRNSDTTSLIKSFDIDNIFFTFTDIGEQVPFLKKTSRVTGSLIKLYKPLIDAAFQSDSAAIVDNDIDAWCKLEVFKKSRVVDTLIVKILLPNTEDGASQRYATLTVLSSGICDLKLKFGVDSSRSIRDIIKIIQTVNGILKTLDPNIVPFDTQVFEDINAQSYTKIVRMTVASIFSTSQKVASLESLTSAVTNSMKQIFAVVPNETSNNPYLHLVYKLVDNFGMDESITFYIARQRSVGMSVEMIHDRIMSMFDLDQKEATRYLQEWKNRFQNSFSKYSFINRRVFKPIAQYVNIKIKPTSSGYKLVVDGLNRKAQYQTISKLIQVLLDVASKVKSGAKSKGTKKPKVAGMKEKDIDKADEIVSKQIEDLDDDVVDHDDADKFADYLLDMILKDDNPNNDQDDEKLKNTKTDSHANTHSNDESDDDEIEVPVLPGKRQYDSALLRELASADPKLFSTKGDTSYAKICQKSAERQPIVVTREEFKKLPKDSYPNYLNYGSTEKLAEKNYYMCPDVWCPKSRLTMSKEQFEAAGNKCPGGKTEVPQVFYTHPEWADEKGVARPRYVGYLHAKNHPDRLCMPCCYKTIKHMQSCEVDKVKGNERYILTANIAAENGRFSVLPAPLSTLLGNPNNKGGIMSNKAPYYLRQGVSLRHQSFLWVMSQVLNNEDLKDDNDVINAILNNMTVELFLSLQDGWLFKRFMSLVDPQSIYVQNNFNDFKAWYQKDAYSRAFKDKYLYEAIMSSATFSQKDLSYSKLVLREYLIYMAYRNFRYFIKDETVIKTHEFLLSLFNMNLKWLNKKAYNIVVFETDSKGDVYIPCSIIEPRLNKPFIFLVKTNTYYEPLVYVVASKNEIRITQRFSLSESSNSNVGKLINYISKQCFSSNSLVNKADYEAELLFTALQKTGRSVDGVILNYDMRVYAVVLKATNVVLRLRQPCTLRLVMSVWRSASLHYIFVSKLKKLVEKMDSNEFSAIVKELDKLTKTKSYLGTSSKVDHTHIEELLKDAVIFENDLHMMIQWQENDERKLFIDKSRTLDAIYTSMWNEALRYVQSNKKILADVLFLRHYVNPLPNSFKKKVFDSIFKNSAAFSNRMYVALSPVDRLDHKNFHNRSCNQIGNRYDCTGQCKWIVKLHKKTGRTLGGHCRLHIPDTELEQFYNRLVNELSNPYLPLRQRHVVLGSKIDNNVIVLTDVDIKQGKIAQLFGSKDTDAWGFKRKDTLLDSDLFHEFDKAVQNNNGIANIPVFVVDPAKIVLKMPTEVKSLFAGFGTHPIFFKEVGGTEYSCKAFYTFFAMLFNMTHDGKIIHTAASLQEYVNSAIMAAFIDDPDATTPRLIYNPSFAVASNKSKVITVEVLKDALNSTHYYPSDFEAQILAGYLGINLLILGRKSKTRNPDSIWCLGKHEGAQYTVILKHYLDAAGKHDVYEIVVRDSKFIFETEDFLDTARSFINKKCKIYKL